MSLVGGGGNPPPTIGPATLTIDNTCKNLDAAYFNGTYFTSIAVNSSQEQDITSGDCYLYIEVSGIWFKCDSPLYINAGENFEFFYNNYNSTQVFEVSGPGAALK